MKHTLDMLKIAESRDLFSIVPSLVSFIDLSTPGRRCISESENGQDLKTLFIRYFEDSPKMALSSFLSFASLQSLNDLPVEDWQFIYDVISRTKGKFESYVISIEKYVYECEGK